MALGYAQRRFALASIFGLLRWSGVVGTDQATSESVFADLGVVLNSTNPDWQDICAWSDWDDWSNCSCSGGVSRRSRSRLVTWESSYAAGLCQEQAHETGYCGEPCVGAVVHCQWGPWSSFSECSATCGTGRTTRERQVAQHEGYLGLPCEGAATESQECDAGTCLQSYMLFWGIGLVIAAFCVFGYVVWSRRWWRVAFPVVPIIADEESDAEAECDDEGGSWFCTVPKYWSNYQHSKGTNFHELVYVSSQHYPKFDELLRRTHWPVCTQDRPCPKGVCPKTHLGCACVQPGGDPGLPVEYRVRRVIRVESAKMWSRYAQRRQELAAERREEVLDRFNPALRSSQTINRHPEIFEPLDDSLNEAYAMHGTSVRAALCIGQEHYRIDLAGSGAGTMYGAGTYLAESCTKADEYARDEPSGYYEGVYAMVLSRACMGKFFFTTQRDDFAGQLFKSGDFDSTFGDREQSAGTFRELVLYDTDQVYPEYILLYHRVHKADDGGAVASVIERPLHLELPIYWRNCHRDARQQAFIHQFRVRKATLRLLQRLIAKSMPDDLSWKVIRARRVENSRMWNRYNSFKAALQSRLVADGATCVERDAAHDRRSLVRNLTQSFEEQAISNEHMAEALNEHLLWHGTNKAAAERIAIHDFSIPKVDDAKHGRRFGLGVYLAETVGKALEYTLEENGLRYVLLCRVVCGELYVTDKLEDCNAHAHAWHSGKHTVLADPGGCFAREYVALQTDQIYPEYILELEKDPAFPPAPPTMPPPFVRCEPPVIQEAPELLPGEVS